ncbi:MAG: hypothetical protein WC683_04785 [bacterium]
MKTTFNYEERQREIMNRAIASGFFRDMTSVIIYGLELVNREKKLGVNGTFAPHAQTLEAISP